MPDLTLHNARWCAENEYAERTYKSSDGKTEYTCTYGGTNSGEYAMSWHCTCSGFRFRKTCKHVEIAEASRCTYGWEAAAGSPVEMGEECPECGGATTVMSYAV
jgi:hypothetical protein